ncbi:MAG TPA: DCC1-like thiol-disulfide oxidoreductase family protein [Polyangiaceae bacterium]
MSATTADGQPHVLRALVRRWASVDMRSLGALRIALGLLLMADLGERFCHAEAFYSNSGVLTNHFALFRPIAPHQFSLFLALSQVADVEVAFAGTLLVYFAFLVGYRTRLFHALSFVLATSLHSRNLLAELPSDVPLHWLLLWTFLLPLGARFSVDAVRKSWGERREHSPEDLQTRVTPPRDFTSLAVLGLLLQLAGMHVATALAAQGDAWQDGSALSFALQHPAWSTVLGRWVAAHASVQNLANGYRALYFAAGALVLVPWAPVRKIAFASLLVLHLAGRALFDFGLYDWVLLVPALILMEGSDWDFLRDAYAARKRRLTVYFDADCGICFAVARLLVRLDALHRLTFAAGASEDSPAEVRALADRTICVRAEPGGIVETKSRSFARILRSLPFLAPAGWLLLAPGVSWLADRIYSVIARHRADISVFFGFAACGLPHAPSKPRIARPVRRSAFAPAVREVAAAWVLAFAVLAFALRIDDEVGAHGWYGELVGYVAYPRLFQLWRPPFLVGRASQFDAFAPRGEEPDPLADTRGSRLWAAYSARIAEPRFSVYLDGLREFARHKAGQP